MAVCRCQTREVDVTCGTGLYMIGKITGIAGVMACKGFLDLSDYTRERVLGEYQHWLDEYYKHVEREGIK